MNNYIAESELVINEDGSIFHLHIKPEQLADRVILVGDPGRVNLVASHFDICECEAANREFHSKTGTYKGKRITVLSTGIGCDNIDIVLNELDALANIDFNTRMVNENLRSLQIVRVGTCGGLQPNTPVGTFIASVKSIGFDGLLNYYGRRDEVCDIELEKAFTAHTSWLPQLPAPYVSVSDPELNSKIESFEYQGLRVTNFEMESSALAGLSSLLGHKAMTCCMVLATRRTHNMKTSYKNDINTLILTVLERI